MLQIRHLTFIALLIGSFTTSSTMAETWPQFRGSTGSGVSSETNLPTTWSAESGVLWATNLSGRANSSPAVTKDRIDLTTQEADNTLWVVSFDRKTGKILRKVKVGQGTLVAKGPANLYKHRHNAATPSPIADDNHVWAFFGSGLLVCVDASSGKIVWQKDMVKEYGQYDITFGMGSSPRMWGELLFVSCMTKGPSYVVAFDKLTGKQVWKSDRELPAKDDGPDAYSTPTIFKNGGREELLISGSDHINAYDPKSGKQLWVSSGMTIASPYGRIIASPAASDGVILATSGNPGGGGKGLAIAIRAGGSGDVTKSHRLWDYAKTTADSSTPVCMDGLAYMITDGGVGTCFDLKSGKVQWQKRLGKGPFHAAVVAGDEKVYFLNIEGDCTVVEAGTSGKILATNKLPGTFYAPPAISDGVLYIRAYEKLFAVGGE